MNNIMDGGTAIIRQWTLYQAHAVLTRYFEFLIVFVTGSNVFRKNNDCRSLNSLQHIIIFHQHLYSPTENYMKLKTVDYLIKLPMLLLYIKDTEEYQLALNLNNLFIEGCYTFLLLPCHFNSIELLVNFQMQTAQNLNSLQETYWLFRLYAVYSSSISLKCMESIGNLIRQWNAINFICLFNGPIKVYKYVYIYCE